MKKGILFVSIASVAAIAGSFAFILANNGIRIGATATGEDYTLSFVGGALTESAENESGSVALATDSTKSAAPANQNLITINYHNVSYSDDGSTKWNYLSQGSGYFANDYSSPIRSMKSILVQGVGSVQVSWGWDDGTGNIHYYDSEVDTINGSGNTFLFNAQRPNYIKVAATNYAVGSIKNVVITYDASCSLAPNPNL